MQCVIARETWNRRCRKNRLQQVIGANMNHAESETIPHQDSHAGKGRHPRGRNATACPAPRCNGSGEAYQGNAS